MTIPAASEAFFALDRETGELLLADSLDEAAAHCKPVDVQDGYWLFFADDGSPLEARFPPVEASDPAAHPGAFVLQRAMSGRWLQERLEQVVTLKGVGLESMADLVEMLKINRGRRVAAMGGPPGRR